MSSFYGQQEGERVLYEITIHPKVIWWRLATVIGAGVGLAGLFWIIGTAVVDVTSVVRLIGLVLGLAIVLLGWWGVTTMSRKTSTFITDRRVVRLQAVTPWTVMSRAIAWDEVVKIKTRSPNLFWQLQNIGSVIVHARSTVVPSGIATEEQAVTNDDVQIDGVYYYRDLGNYLDKILYMYKKQPSELTTIRPFVAMPKGKRY